MAFSCVRTVAGRVPENVVRLTTAELKRATRLIRGVWLVPGKGTFYVFESGQAVRVKLVQCSFRDTDIDGANGSVTYESEDGVVSVGSEVMWNIRKRTVRVRRHVWETWTEEDRKIFSDAIRATGLTMKVERNWGFSRFVPWILISVVVITFGFVLADSMANNRRIQAMTTVTTADGNIHVFDGDHQVATVNRHGDDITIRFNNNSLHCASCFGRESEGEHTIRKLLRLGKLYPDIKGSPVITGQILRMVGEKWMIDEIVLSSPVK